MMYLFQVITTRHHKFFVVAESESMAGAMVVDAQQKWKWVVVAPALQITRLAQDTQYPDGKEEVCNLLIQEGAGRRITKTGAES